MFQEDSTTFLALSNSISCLPEENGKKLDISMKELFYWSSAIPQKHVRMNEALVTFK